MRTKIPSNVNVIVAKCLLTKKIILIIIIIIKIFCQRELEKETPCKPERLQNHDTKQDIQQQKETEKKKKIKEGLRRQKFIALLNELKMPPLNTPDGSKFHIRAAAGINYELNWPILQPVVTKLTRPEQLKL